MTVGLAMSLAMRSTRPSALGTRPSISALRLFRWPIAVLPAILVLAPVVALGPAAVLDRGTSGTARATLIHLALAAWDPFVWDCVRQSVMAALIVATGSWLIGVGLARVVGRWRFWGR